MRLGLVSLLHESNTFLPEPTLFEAFERDHVLTGTAILDFFAGGHHEVSGMLAGLQEQRLDVRPLFAARAVPSGIIAAGAADRLLKTLLAQLESSDPLDGLLVALHGAAVAEDHRDFDGCCLQRLRQALGPDRPIICTLDAHANVSPAMVKAATALITYRTNPHLDQKERGVEAADLMIRTLRGQTDPVQAAALPPVAIGIETQHTSRPPLRQLYRLAEDMRDRPGLLSISIVLGFPYADVLEMGSGFIAVADGDRAVARAAAMELASCLWEDRARYAAGAANVEEALAQLELRSAADPVGLLDIGDNVGGGSPGDGTLLAQGLHRRRVRGFVCLWDPAAAAEARRTGAGGRCRLAMGARSGSQPGGPIDSEVTVLRIHPGRYVETNARHGGMTDFDMGPTAVVQTDAGLTIMLNTHRVMPVSLSQLTCCGVDPRHFDAIVLKGVHAPVAAYEPVCSRLILVDTPGPTRCNLRSFEYHHRRRPLYPLEEDCPCVLEQTLV